MSTVQVSSTHLLSKHTARVMDFRTRKLVQPLEVGCWWDASVSSCWLELAWKALKAFIKSWESLAFHPYVLGSFLLSVYCWKAGAGEEERLCPLLLFYDITENLSTFLQEY